MGRSYRNGALLQQRGRSDDISGIDRSQRCRPQQQPPLVKAAPRQRRGIGSTSPGPEICHANFGAFIGRVASMKAAEPADKPGSVLDSHSSRRNVTVTLKQPTRTRRGPRHEVPIWSCSRWGLPCRPVARLAVRSYRTISPLPRTLPPLCRFRRHLAGLRRQVRLLRQESSKGVTGPFGGIFLLHFPSACAAQGLPGTVPCGARTFLGIVSNDATVWPTPPRALSHARQSVGLTPVQRLARCAADFRRQLGCRGGRQVPAQLRI